MNEFVYFSRKDNAKTPFRSLAGEKVPPRSAPEQKRPWSCDRGVSLIGAGNLLGEQDFEDLDGAVAIGVPGPKMAAAPSR